MSLKPIHNNNVCFAAMSSPLDFFLLPTEGVHSPDGRQHLLGHSTGLGVRALLFGSEACQHLFESNENQEKMAAAA